jgi:hypothetical protein
MGNELFCLLLFKSLFSVLIYSELRPSLIEVAIMYKTLGENEP